MKKVTGLSYGQHLLNNTVRQNEHSNTHWIIRSQCRIHHVECSCRLFLWLSCNATGICKILTSSLEKNKWLDFDSSSIQFSTLTQMTISVIRLRLDSCPWFSRWTQLWLNGVKFDSRLIMMMIWALGRRNKAVIWRPYTHNSWVEHNPD